MKNMRIGFFCLGAFVACAALCVNLARTADAANGVTQVNHTVSQPTRTGADEVIIHHTVNGVNKTTVVTVQVNKSDTPQSKAVKYAAAINAVPGLTAAAALSTVAMGGTGANDNIKSVKVRPEKNDPKKGSGQKMKKYQAMVAATTSSFDVQGTATGISLDSEAPVVRVGTERGIASVITTPGMTAQESRDALRADLIQLGVDAIADGATGITIQMDALDGDLLEWGHSGSGVGTSGESSID